MPDDHTPSPALRRARAENQLRRLVGELMRLDRLLDSADVELEWDAPDLGELLAAVMTARVGVRVEPWQARAEQLGMRAVDEAAFMLALDARRWSPTMLALRRLHSPTRSRIASIDTRRFHGPAEYLAVSSCGCASSPTRRLVTVCPLHRPPAVAYRRVSLSELMRVALLSPAEFNQRLNDPEA